MQAYRRCPLSSPHLRPGQIAVIRTITSMQSVEVQHLSWLMACTLPATRHMGAECHLGTKALTSHKAVTRSLQAAALVAAQLRALDAP